jgi:integration host factor subunit beta|tara:strand:- start:934 stop:1221 length:288 start_codon:yes stop_codon:yes gene_type:complete
LALVKSKILKQLSDNYPNFLNKNLSKLIEIIISHMENSLVRNERVELRDIFTLETKIQKARISRNPKTNEKVEIPEKKAIHFKMSKKWFKDLNNE